MTPPSTASLDIKAHANVIALVRHNFIGVDPNEAKLDVLQKNTTLKMLRGLEQLYVPFAELDVTTSAIYPGKLGHCFEFATRASLQTKDLIYCEGLATNVAAAGIPLHHAWCVHRTTGLVVDPVWKDTSAGVGYCGIPFNTRFLHTMLDKARRYGVLDNIYCLHKDFDAYTIESIVHKDFLDYALSAV